MIRRVSIANRFGIGTGCPPALIAGPCILESEELALSVASFLADLAARVPVNVVFKGSFDKANRSSRSSYRGPGEDEGLRILAKVRERHGLPVTTDVHDPRQARTVGPLVDLLQIPAFLCRQTDLLVAARGAGGTWGGNGTRGTQGWSGTPTISTSRSSGDTPVIRSPFSESAWR